MLRTMIVYAPCQSYYPPNVAHNWANLRYTSSDPNEWRQEDVEAIEESLANCARKHPIINVEFLGKNHIYSRQTEFPNVPLKFKITYEIKVPKTTLSKNKEMVRNMILMECI